MSVSFHLAAGRFAGGMRQVDDAPAGLLQDAARAFVGALAELSPASRGSGTSCHGRSGGVYSSRTTEGVRWRFVYRRSDGTQTSKRGFTTGSGGWRGANHTWSPVPGPTTIHGRRRLVPAFGSGSLGELSVDEIRNLVAELAEAGELTPKTVNNAPGTLVVCLNAALEDGLIATNPALRVQRLPPAHIEPDYLRLDEILRYLDACSDVHRPLAALLVGSGLRISEALGLRGADLELEKTAARSSGYRSRKKDVLGSTGRGYDQRASPGLIPLASVLMPGLVRSTHAVGPTIATRRSRVLGRRRRASLRRARPAGSLRRRR